MRGKIESKIEKDKIILKKQEISVNILDDPEIEGLFLIETKLKFFDKVVKIPGWV